MATLEFESEPSFHWFVWGYVQDQIRCIKAEFIPELQRAVEDVSATILMEMLRDAVQNLRKRAQTFLEASGGHFKYFSDISKKRRL